jgi:hypothetical protein
VLSDTGNLVTLFEESAQTLAVPAARTAAGVRLQVGPY